MIIKKLVSVSLVIFFTAVATIVLMGKFVSPDKQLLSLETPTDKKTTALALTSAAGSNAQTSTSQTDMSQPSANLPQTTTNSVTNPSSSPIAESTPTTTTSNPATTPPTTPAPTPIPPTPIPISCGQAGGGCTTGQVATHNSSSNCWMIYNGSYYIVTNYVKAHPGGGAVFNSTSCGVDATGYLNGSKSTAGKTQKHSSGAYTTLNSYKVGPVI